MRKCIYGVFAFVGLVLSYFGLGGQEVQATPVQTIKAIENACDGGLVFSDILNNQKDTFIAAHYSHSSHRSHYSSRF